MLGLGVMILSMAIIRGFKAEIREKIRGFAGDVQIVKSDLNNSYENSSFIPEPGLIAKLKGNNNIAHINAFATKPGIIKANNDREGVIMKGVDKNYDWGYMKKMLVSGSVIDFRDSAEAMKQVMISQVIAKRLKLKAGDDLLIYFVQETPRKRKLKIKGIFDIGADEIDKNFIIGDINLIKRLNDWNKGEVGGYEVRVADFDQLNPTADWIDDKLPILLKSYTVVENYPVIFEWLGLLDANAVVMLVLMTVVAVINMISALLIMILERTSMIGMLKAMGAQNWVIQKVFLYNAAYLIGVGLLLGNLLGLGIGYFQQHTHFFALDPANYYMAFVPIQFSVFDVVLLNVGTLVICLLVLIIPSMLVTRISPVRAIRFK